MNRQQRRSQGHQQGGELRYLETPCTIAEAAQIARGVAEDVVADFQKQAGHLQIAISLQVEILKDIVISSGLITEEEFKEKYLQQAEIFNKMQQAVMEEMQDSTEELDNTPKMETSVSDIEVQLL